MNEECIANTQFNEWITSRHMLMYKFGHFMYHVQCIMDTTILNFFVVATMDEEGFVFFLLSL